MRTVGIIGLGRHYDLSVGYHLGKELFRNLGDPVEQLLVNSRTSTTIDSFFQQGVKEVLEQNLDRASLEQRFSYRKKRSTCSVEDIVHDAVRRATYEEIAEHADIAVVCLEAKLPTVEITPALARKPDLRKELYQANALEIQKISPYFKDYREV